MTIRGKQVFLIAWLAAATLLLTLVGLTAEPLQSAEISPALQTPL